MKRIIPIALILALVLTLGAIPAMAAPVQTVTPATVQDSDTQLDTGDTKGGDVLSTPIPIICTVSKWAKPELQNAIDATILRKNSWRRSTNLTEDCYRGEFCMILDNVLESLGIVDYTSSDPELEGSEDMWDVGQNIDYDNPPFDDLWFDDLLTCGSFVYRLWSLGIAKGVSDNHFGQWDTLTREQAATFVVRTANVIGVDLKDADIPFTDNISSWAMDGVRCCYGSGIMKGVSDTRFAGKDNLTREQAILIALRLYELAANK